MQPIRNHLGTDGYAVIESVFSADSIQRTRDRILDNLSLFKNTRASDSSRHLAAFHRYPSLEPLHTALTSNPQVLAVLKTVFGEQIVTIGLSDITINRSQQWHKDVLREKYAYHLEGIQVFDSKALAPIKALVYLQDSSSLKVLPGSHLQAADLQQGDKSIAEEPDHVEAIQVNAGDVILIDIRLTHAGSQESDFTAKALHENPKILVSTVFAKDQCPFSRAMERGNQERLFDWQDRTERHRVNAFHRLEKEEGSGVQS